MHNLVISYISFVHVEIFNEKLIRAAQVVKNWILLFVYNIDVKGARII